MLRAALFFLLFIPGLAHSQAWTLDSCIRYALEHNLTLESSQLNVDIAEANQEAAFGGLLPSLNAQASHGYNWGQKIDPFTNSFASARIRSNSLGIAANINLFNGLQQQNTLKQANLNIQSSKLNFEKTRNDVALNVASAYLTVLLNMEIAEIAKRNLESTDRQASRLGKLFNAGQVSEGQLNEMLAQQATDEANLVSAKNSVELSRLALMQLMMLNSFEMQNFKLVVPNIETVDQSTLMGNVESTIQTALTNFPEIKSAQVSAASSGLGVKIAKGARLPSLSATASFGSGYSGAAKIYSGTPSYELVPIGAVQNTGELVVTAQPVYNSDDFRVKGFGNQITDNVNRSLFFNLTIPIFNGFSSRSSIKRAEVNAIQANLKLEQAKQQLEQSVQQAHANVLAAYASYKATEKSVEASKKAFAWSELRYEQGLTNAVEYADARTRLDNAQANLTRNKFDYYFKLKILEFYQGKPISLN
jgi:outer membrane protein